MLRKKALRKIFITTVSVFIIMSIYLIPVSDKSISTSLEFEYVTGLNNSSIYLLDENNLLVKTKILLDDKKLEDNVKNIINNLKEDSNNKFSDKLRGVIPRNTKINDIRLENTTISIDFSSSLLDVSKELSKKLIEALTFSLTELQGIDSVNIKVDGTLLEYYPNTKIKLFLPLTRNIGINNEYSYTTLDDITKVVVYYQEVIDEDVYYVPVTKYLNNDKDKIDIIVEELTTSYIHEDNLQSILNEDVRLIDKEINEELLVLNFNSALFDSDSTIKEEVLYMLSYSVFANYDVNMVDFKVDGVSLKNIKKSDLS